MNILEVKHARKSYSGVEALKDVSFNVPEGTLFGLLGPNGAGKTTLVKSAAGLLHLDGGDIVINGVSCRETEARKELAFLPEAFRFYPYYTVSAALNFFCDLSQVPRTGRAQIIERALDIARIKDLASRKVSTLSRGQTQRVGIAALFLAAPRLLILDEPFSGLDPISMKELKDALRTVRDEGRTVLINSHILSEIENLCDSVAILHEGNLLAEGEIGKLKKNSTLEEFFYSAVTGSSGSVEKSDLSGGEA